MTSAPLVAWTLDGAHLAVPIDLRVFSIDAVLRATYKLTDRCFVFLDRTGGEGMVAYLVGRQADSDVGPLALELRNELIDQQLRCRLEERFGDVRTLIVAQAFSEGNLLDAAVPDHAGDTDGPRDAR